MSRDFMEDYFEHSWGKKPEQKAREKEYNKEYYQKHKDKWKKYDSWLHDSNAPNRRASEAAAANERAKSRISYEDAVKRSSSKGKNDNVSRVVKGVTKATDTMSNVAGLRAGGLVSPVVYRVYGKVVGKKIKAGADFVSKLLDKLS